MLPPFSTVVSEPPEHKEISDGLTSIQRVADDKTHSTRKNYLQIPFFRATNADMHSFQSQLLTSLHTYLRNPKSAGDCAHLKGESNRVGREFKMRACEKLIQTAEWSEQPEDSDWILSVCLDEKDTARCLPLGSTQLAHLYGTDVDSNKSTLRHANSTSQPAHGLDVGFRITLSISRRDLSVSKVSEVFNDAQYFEPQKECKPFVVERDPPTNLSAYFHHKTQGFLVGTVLITPENGRAMRCNARAQPSVSAAEFAAGISRCQDEYKALSRRR